MAASLVEQINYEAALADITVEIQSGGGIRDEIWLEMPEPGAVGFAELVQPPLANEPQGLFSVEQNHGQEPMVHI